MPEDSPSETPWVSRRRRLGKLASLLILLQLLSAFVGINEAVFDHPPTLISIFVSAAVAIAWLSLAAWSGLNRLTAFPRLALTFWGIVALIVLAMMWTVARAADSPESAGFILLLVLFAAVPLDGLASLIPLDDQLTRCLIVAVAVPCFSLACYAASKVFRKRVSAETTSPQVG